VDIAACAPGLFSTRSIDSLTPQTGAQMNTPDAKKKDEASKLSTKKEEPRYKLGKALQSSFKCQFNLRPS
jgi:hypothetical protein